MALDWTKAEPGDRVSYEDMANPLRSGTIGEVVETEWGTAFLVVFGPGEAAWTDLRQRGWRVSPAGDTHGGEA